jgi:uncharacterized membrane protein required for colicin V production
MPWADIVIVFLILLAAFIGYNVGLFGALKGFVGSILGLIAAWFLAPLGQAWLETQWNVETLMARFLRDQVPINLRDLIRGIANTAQTMQEFRERLLNLPFPEEVIQYLQRTYAKAPSDVVPTPDMMINIIAHEIASSILWAVLFIIIWTLTSFIVKELLGLLFVAGDGKTILGFFDGILGMLALTVLIVSCMIVFCGLIYPVILIPNIGGGAGEQSAFHNLLLDSALFRWMAGIYQSRVIPWLG